MPEHGRRVLLSIAALTTVGVLVACGAGVRPPAPSPAASDVTVTSRGIAFDRSTLNVPAGRPFSLRLVNEDAAPHNVSIYTDESAAESHFVGDYVTSATIDYQVPTLEAGTYFFRCDLHPDMKGTVVAD